MELKVLKEILTDLEYSFENQRWIRDTRGNFHEEFMRREKDIKQLREAVEDIEKKAKVFTEIPIGYPRLPNIRIPLNIEIEVERYIKPERMERMDHMEKGAAIGRPRKENE